MRYPPTHSAIAYRKREFRLCRPPPYPAVSCSLRTGEGVPPPPSATPHRRKQRKTATTSPLPSRTETAPEHRRRHYRSSCCRMEDAGAGRRPPLGLAGAALILHCCCCRPHVVEGGENRGIRLPFVTLANGGFSSRRLSLRRRVDCVEVWAPVTACAELVVAEHPDGFVIPRHSLPFGSEQQQRETPAVSGSSDIGDVDSPSSVATLLSLIFTVNSSNRSTVSSTFPIQQRDGWSLDGSVRATFPSLFSGGFGATTHRPFSPVSGALLSSEHNAAVEMEFPATPLDEDRLAASGCDGGPPSLPLVSFIPVLLPAVQAGVRRAVVDNEKGQQLDVTLAVSNPHDRKKGDDGLSRRRQVCAPLCFQSEQQQ
nr:hypothetical protein Iba_chr01aCG4560 [Ipomoea batatas]